MSHNPRTATDRDIRVEDFAAELTSAAYPLVLRCGMKQLWLTVELGLWTVLAKTVKGWAGQRQPAASGDREAWREGLLRAPTASARSIVLNHGTNGPRSEVESGLDQAFWHVISNRTHVNLLT
jgi:hypothetical protein